MEYLKEVLWERWGSPEFPAEWDGRTYGGGKGSQRFWEYLWVVDHLSGTERKILDVGAGPTVFLPRLLEQGFTHVESVDPDLPNEDDRHHRMDLGSLLRRAPSIEDEFDCVTSVSVLEHLEDPTGLFTDLSRFRRAKILVTLELGQDPPGFEYQLTLGKLYSGLRTFRDHYVSRMETCPVWADNSKGGDWRPFGMMLLPRTGVAGEDYPRQVKGLVHPR